MDANPYKRQVAQTRAKLIAAGKGSYDATTFESSFLAELGRLMRRERKAGKLQDSPGEFHQNNLLNFRRRYYEPITESRISEQARRLQETAVYKWFSVLLIVLQAVIVALQAETGNGPTISALDKIVTCLFCAECLFVALGYGKTFYYNYFVGLRIGKWESAAKWNT